MTAKHKSANLALAVGLVAVAATLNPAHAAEMRQTRETTRTYYADAKLVEGAPVSVGEYVLATTPPRTLKDRLFRAYEYTGHRERCQHYVAAPEGYFYRGCDIVAPTAAPAAAATATERVETRRTEAPGLLPSVAEYKVYFDFDKSGIRGTERATLDRVSSEIKTYDPVEVTVTGHADAAGPADYNQALSRRRAESVVAELQRRGIPSRVLDEKARGESDLAVPTPDGVREPLNRRVTIDFRR